MSEVRGKSLTLRLTLLFAAVSTSVLLLLGLIVASLVDRHFEELDMALLHSRLAQVSHLLAGTDASRLPARLDESLVGEHGLALALWDGDGKTLYSAGEADFPASIRQAAPGSEQPSRWRNADGGEYRGIAGRAAASGDAVTSIVIGVATDQSHHEHFMHSFRLALWSVVGLAALASGLLGWVAARKGLGPLRAISRNAAAITASNLDQRLPEASIPRELAEVVRTLNDMLTRLQDSFQRLSDFSSDLAHELRTPVGNLLTQTQVTLSRARSAAEYQDVLASNAEEFERLSKMISDMLFLAKADNALAVPRREPVDLRQQAEELAEFYEALAEENGVILSVDGEASAAGDKLMLRRALGNLLSNALAHTPRGGTIRIVLAGSSNGGTSVSVINTGPGIAAEHLPRLFDRFYRADPSRHRHAEGAGLGLAITRSIARAHGGDASVESANGVTSFRLTLPGASA